MVPFRERLTWSIADAVEATGISRAQLYRMIDDGKIATRKEGDRRLVLVRSLVDRFDAAAPAPANDQGSGGSP